MAKHSFIRGEKVATINDMVEGTVVRTQGNKVVIVCEDGFEQEYEISELIKLSNWDHWIGEPIAEEKERAKESRSKARKPGDSTTIEVDLHLHEITDFEKGMTNHEKLQLQLGVARKELDQAIKEKRKKIVFIHGRGQGVLRKELHKLLGHYPVEFLDASYMEYGQGATEVRIYQNRSK